MMDGADAALEINRLIAAGQGRCVQSSGAAFSGSGFAMRTYLLTSEVNAAPERIGCNDAPGRCAP